jgi:hypothetical protein
MNGVCGGKAKDMPYMLVLKDISNKHQNMGTAVGDAPQICRAEILLSWWCVCVVSRRYYWKGAIRRVYFVAYVGVGGQSCVRTVGAVRKETQSPERL